MSGSEVLRCYVRMAQTAGTEVEIVKADDLADRLGSILSMPRAELCGAGDSVHCPAGTSSPSARVAAIPAFGWPEELLRRIKAVLKSAGYGITTPYIESGRFRWNRDQLAKASVGITFCSAFLADTGSIVMPSGPGLGSLAGLLPKIHIVLSHAEGCRESLVEYLSEDGFSLPSRLTLVSGPSRTGDIEAVMTTGVHGPGRVLHLIIEGEWAVKFISA
ncbi:MAG: lactate utilization protein [Syntrophobacter sp.]